MTPERWKRIDELFEAALEVDPPQRSDFLVGACKGDTNLRADVERLLRAHEKAGTFIESPPVEEAASLFFDSDQSSMVGRSILHYSVLSPLGVGGMGQVYLARDMRLGRRVALKLLPGHSTSDREMVRRFQQEASAASALNHPNILTIYEVAQEDQLHFIAAEYIEGVTLRERMREQRLTMLEALDFAIQITGALAAAHNAGIVHRDIKPENVMIRPDGLVKVLDFGLAKLTQPAEESGNAITSDVSDVRTDPGTVMGTVHYMSPEQARAQPIDARSDVFATGVLLYEMLSGRRPFTGESSTDVLAAILQKPHAPLRSIIPNVSADLDRILDRALAKKRDQRHSHAGELLGDLSRLRRDLEAASKQKPASCPACRKENPPGFAFCTGCGTALKKACPGCRELVGADDSFCGLCGHRFSGTDSLPSATRITAAMGAAQSQTMSTTGAERRRATVVYAIVSGCDAILEQFDPEHADRAIAGIKEAVAEVINAHGGILDRCNNEEMVALFGVPASYEDDFVRAARAALALRERIAELSRDVEARIGHPLRVYAAINSGPLVARLADDGRYSVSGEPLQIASRLAGRADAGEILVGPETQRLIAPFFTLEEKGAFSLGAKARPVVIHRVTGETGVRTRLEAAEAFGLTRHTARERELTELRSMLDRTLAGEGQFVTVAGDAGIGKSRLLLEFRRRLDEREIPLLVGRCQPNRRNIPYLPFIDVLTDLLKLREKPSAEGLRAAAIAGIEAIDENLAAYIPVYLHLLSIQSDEHKLAPDLKGDHLTHSILEALSAIITLNSKRQPSVVVLEDWHWADEGSEEAVRRLASLAPSYPLMVIVSFRPERMLDWGYVDARTIQLSPFDERSTVEVLRSILNAREVPAGLARLLFNRTGGNPFFIEEVCRTLIESGRIRVTKGIARVEGRISDLDLPETVQAVIRTRLDRLDPDSQRVLRYAAIIGREFSLPLLERIADGASQTGSSLEMLQKHGLIQQIRVLPERVYRFRHVLTQEVAYDSLLLHQRKGLHQAAGEAIEHLYGDRIEEQLELLVHHYSSAEDWERAARFGVDSADKASGLSRFAEALTMLERSEEWLLKLPDDAERKQELVRLLLKQERLAETLVLRERQQALIDRLLSILDPASDRGLFADVLVRQGELFTLLSRFDEAERALAEALSIHREIDNPSGERVALRMMGFLRWQQGRYEESEECNRTALSIDLAQDDRAGYAQDLTNLGSVLRGTGRLEEGLRCLEEAYQIHEEMRRPFNQVYTLDVMANLYRDLGDHDRAMEYYKRAGEIAAHHRWHLQRRFPLGAMASLAWERGRTEESLRYSRELVDAVRGLGLKHDLARALATLSHRLLESQRETEALPFLREAADIFREVGDKDGEARTLTSVAYVSGRSGGGADSLSIWERVRVLRREQSDSAGELEALEGLASVSRLQSNQPELALQYLDQAWQLAVALDDSARQGDLLNTMGIVEWNRGNYSSAAEHYRRALDVFRNSGDQVHAGLMLNSLAVTMARLARSSEAAELLQEALTSHRATGQRLLEGHALAALGDIHAANSEYRQALDCYSESLEIRKAIGDRRGEGWMLYQIARVSVKTEAADQAADLLSRASAIASEIGDDQLSSACALLDQVKIEKE